MDGDPVVPAQSPVRWIGMTRGDEEEGREVHLWRVEVEPDDITTGWMRDPWEVRVAGQQRPSRRVVLVPQTDTLHSTQDRCESQAPEVRSCGLVHLDAITVGKCTQSGTRFEALGEMSDTESAFSLLAGDALLPRITQPTRGDVIWFDLHAPEVDLPALFLISARHVDPTHRRLGWNNRIHVHPACLLVGLPRQP